MRLSLLFSGCTSSVPLHFSSSKRDADRSVPFPIIPISLPTALPSTFLLPSQHENILAKRDRSLYQARHELYNLLTEDAKRANPRFDAGWNGEKYYTWTDEDIRAVLKYVLLQIGSGTRLRPDRWARQLSLTFLCYLNQGVRRVDVVLPEPRSARGQDEVETSVRFKLDPRRDQCIVQSS
jgi:hypothetical protein